ncbi:MAG: hypothetical protein PHN56_05185 [Candidatus Nanoarchaeia archaeon]|nr:hypothetical protein [Candidatus Nanoarchaeia archaeon]
MKLIDLIIVSVLVVAYGLIMVSLTQSGQVFYLNNSSMGAFSSFTVLP